MSHVYTPNSSNNPTVVTLPDDGDDESAASVGNPLEDLADKAAHMNLPEQSSSAHYPLASRSLTRVSRSAPLSTFDIGNQPDWTFGPNTAPISSVGGTWMVAVNAPASGQLITQVLEAPDGATVTTVTTYLQGSAGHGALPATMPATTLYKLEVSTGIVTSLGSRTDSSGGTTSYQAAHPNSLVGGTHFTAFVVDNSAFVYFVTTSNELGANSQVGLSYYGVRTTFTTTRLDDA